MVPREKMAVLELTMAPEQVLEAVRQGAHTRMPVYAGEPDNIVGIVNTKDLFFLFSCAALWCSPTRSTTRSSLSPTRRSHGAAAVPQGEKADGAVRDDDGKILGLITLEDVLEEIVGDIEDEHDQPRPSRPARRLRRLRKPPAPHTGKVDIRAPKAEANPQPK